MLKLNNKIPTYIEIDGKSAASISIKNHIVWRKEQPTYFYIQPLASTTFDSTNFAFIGENNVLYSLNGYSWTTFETGSTQVNINANDKLYLRTINDYERPTSDTSSHIKVNVNYNIGGSLDTLIKNSAYYLFADDTNIVSAKELIVQELKLDNLFDSMFRNCANLIEAPTLPATTLFTQCYYGMFFGCSSLVEAPTLPATTMVQQCYGNMFLNCTSLVNAPELPATILADYCFQNMFYGCSSLTSGPTILPAMTLSTRCYDLMFYNCSNLTLAPLLPATALADRCYRCMFYGCSNLTLAPLLPATTMVQYCYGSMFEYCTSLVEAPELPATILANNCYQLMFSRCSALTKAPLLPAITLASNCYQLMFQYCSKLKTIYCNARYSSGTTSITSSISTNWLYNVTNTTSCTFYKNPDWAGPTTRGANTIPTNWKIVNWVLDQPISLDDGDLFPKKFKVKTADLLNETFEASAFVNYVDEYGLEYENESIGIVLNCEYDEDGNLNINEYTNVGPQGGWFSYNIDPSSEWAQFEYEDQLSVDYTISNSGYSTATIYKN